MRDDGVLMVKLSVNVNKVATLRNSRGGHLPSVIEAVRVCVDAGAASFAQYAGAASLAHELGLGVNAGHDLDLRNLTVFHGLPHLDEVSIGHALIGHALYVGLRQAVLDYKAAVDGRHV